MLFRRLERSSSHKLNRLTFEETHLQQTIQVTGYKHHTIMTPDVKLARKDVDMLCQVSVREFIFVDDSSINTEKAFRHSSYLFQESLYNF